MNRGRSVAAGVALAVTILAIRLVNLSADPPSWLSWSAGIYTDEGFYGADARQLMHTGHWSPGNFHGAILSPVLYVLQLLVFRIFGPGLVAARAVSAVCGSCSVLLLFWGLRRFYDNRTAWIGAVFLGFSTIFVFYNRLALMETPCAMLMTGSFVCAAVAVKRIPGQPGRSADKDEGGIRSSAAALCGSLFALAVIAKILIGPAIAAPIIATCRRTGLRPLGWMGLGFITPVVLVIGLWCAPYLGHLREMDHYYWTRQLSPRTLGGLMLNWDRALFTGQRDGLLPSLGRLDPVLLIFGIAGLATALALRTDGDWFLVGWLPPMVVLLCCLSYTPTRYDVLFAPALAGLAARSVARWPRWGIWLGVALFLVPQILKISSVVLHPAYTVRDSSAALAALAPRNSVVVGQMAPELCMDTKLTPIMVQPGLANDVRPIERFDGTIVLVTRSAYWRRWWQAHYPTVGESKNLIGTLKAGPVLAVDVYKVPSVREAASHAR